MKYYLDGSLIKMTTNQAQDILNKIWDSDNAAILLIDEEGPHLYLIKTMREFYHHLAFRTKGNTALVYGQVKVHRPEQISIIYYFLEKKIVEDAEFNSIDSITYAEIITRSEKYCKALNKIVACDSWAA